MDQNINFYQYVMDLFVVRLSWKKKLSSYFVYV